MFVQLASARGVAGLIGLFVAGVVSAQVQPPVEFATPLSPRNANYTIEVDLDPGSKMLNGRQTVVWSNTQETAVNELWFHLYWNAWRNNRSTWLLEDRYRNRSDRGGEIQEEDWGYLEVLSVRQLRPPFMVAAGAAGEVEVVAKDDQPPVAAELDLTTATRFASPDDGNADDQTVMVIPLPQPVEPGEAIEVELIWQAKIPRTFARTGFRGDYFFIAHWFPKLGVLEPEGWNTHQYHSGTEYFSDYGVYDVTLTLPSEFVVGSTGKLIEQTENPDDTTTHRYYQEDVHAFTFTASPDYKVVESRFEEPGLPPVDLRLLIQPEHRRQADRHIDATKATLRHYGSWFGPYPYDHLTIVDPAYGSGAGGMEYPTLFTAGSRLFNPFGGGSPEGVTIHEAGHQFWYALVGNKEFEHAWLDEGLNTFSTSRTYNQAYGKELFV
ncbi:MAG: M1 family metallopeptidase, partial [Thermoanaerobaculia bacterium]